MSSQYAPLAEQIIGLVGGPENIASVFNCQTRLRFTLRDDAKANMQAVKDLDGVASALFAGDMFQVIIGTHVKDVFEEVARLLPASAEGPGDDAPAGGAKKKFNPINSFITFISATIMPVIPALAGAGMISALLSLLVVFNLSSTDSPTYIVLAFMANAVFHFLPIFLAFAAADKLKTNRILAAVLAAMMLHPKWAEIVAAGEPIALFEFIPLTLTSYASSVIPILLVVWVQSYIERFLEKIIPNSIKLVVIPMILFLVVGTLAFSLLGPIGTFLGSGIAIGFEWLAANAPWAPVFLVGALWPIMVMFGVHIAVAPLLFLQLSTYGYDSLIGPGAVVANISMAVAGAVVAFRVKDLKEKQIATAGSITAFMGITEPVLYGVNLPKRYPLIAGVIGGAAGGLYAGLMGVRRFAAGSSSIPTLPMYIGEGTMRHLINIVIALLITTAVTGTLTAILGSRFDAKAKRLAASTAASTSAAAPVSTPAAAAVTGSVATAVAVATADLTSPCRGTVVALANVPDAAFASGALGPGIAVEPLDGRIVAPCGGTIVAAMPSGHAYGIRTADGVEVLVHIGVDTVQMKGEGFSPQVKKGDVVQPGQTLAQVDLDAIKAAGHPATVIVIITNRGGIAEISPVNEASDVIAGEPIVALTH
ncbi:beta-glucoside-specific PTS transporter subunit IIABC [Tessaracoccus caeni]|uniref:beta-glucoside-specific PTS transporter subunit IIABC n=1 Tax=Tessaracoccus caeni TaxID=3031239 RepID=UPI0023DCE22E|nr:beta-glucoside-specific PTS transporter subunit IIABC [Tessaracoccus caeni]MDF1489134.1 beta-glucoside-specific PTS transporter subunit IIABC [Tessaracoccus caeni]